MSYDNAFDTNNVHVDAENRFVSIRVNPQIYKMHVIMRAAEELLHDEKRKIDMIVDGDPEKEIIAKFIPKDKDVGEEGLLRLAYKFNTRLISCSGKG